MTGQKRLFSPRDLLAAQSDTSLETLLTRAQTALDEAAWAADGRKRRRVRRLQIQVRRELTGRKETHD